VVGEGALLVGSASACHAQREQNATVAVRRLVTVIVFLRNAGVAVALDRSDARFEAPQTSMEPQLLFR
jgi:hypothetical protein